MRRNMKLERLHRRVQFAHGAANQAIGTHGYAQAARKLRQRTNALRRAQANGDRNRDVNEARNRAEGRRG